VPFLNVSSSAREPSTKSVDVARELFMAGRCLPSHGFMRPPRHRWRLRGPAPSPRRRRCLSFWQRVYLTQGLIRALTSEAAGFHTELNSSRVATSAPVFSPGLSQHRPSWKRAARKHLHRPRCSPVTSPSAPSSPDIGPELGASYAVRTPVVVPTPLTVVPTQLNWLLYPLRWSV
jgi:hypothetical protein